MKIKDLAPSERPREKLKKTGVASLTNADLLSLILRQGSKKENVLEISNNLLRNYDLKSLSRKTISELINNHGIGEAKACQIVAAFELSRRLSAFPKQDRSSIKSAKDIVKLFMPDMSTLKKENFKGVYLDSRKRIIKEETLFVGTLDSSVVHPREIFQSAIKEGAAAIILLHNHPSGDPSPSEEDVEITSQLVKSGEILGVTVLDHIIIGEKSFYSFREKGFI